MFDALVCFSFNVGLGALKGSTLLRLLNQHFYAAAAQQFDRWDKATDPKTGEKVSLSGHRDDAGVQNATCSSAMGSSHDPPLR